MENADLDVYIDNLVTNGMFVVDGQGVGSLNQPVASVLDALHEVLAGGEVSISVTTSGSSTVKATLDEKLEAVVASLNVIVENENVFTP